MGFVDEELEPGLRRNPEGSATSVPDLVFRVFRGLLWYNAIGNALVNDFQSCLLEDVGTPFEKQHSENVFFEFRRIHFAA
jgi:hypothetical protein